jgi:predicted metal-dependent hydrolase
VVALNEVVMPDGLVTYSVTVQTPKGLLLVDVPTFLGQEAAERRAHISVVASGYGDMDEVEVISTEVAGRE